MKKTKSITVNFIMNTILTMSSFIFPLITFPYVSRILLPEGTGKVSFVTSVVSYFAMFAQLGIPVYGIRACARVRDDRRELSRTVQELFLINLIMSILVCMVLYMAVIYIPRLNNEKSLFIVISLLILFNAIGMEWLYKALEQYTYITIRSMLFKLVAVIAMFFLVREPKDYVRYGAITIFASSASNILNFCNVRNYIDISPSGPYRLRRHVKAISVFFAMSCASTIYTNLDAVMLGFMKSDIDVGYYNAAVKIKGILLGLVTSLGTVLLPRVSYYIENGLKDKFHDIAAKAINFVFLIAVPLCVYFVLFAKESIYFLSGKAYEGSIVPMQIIMPTLIFIGLTNIMGIQMLVPMGKEKYVLYSEIAGAVVDLFLNVLMIPLFAAAGAAMGTLVAEIVVWIVQFYFLKNDIKNIFIRRSYVYVVVAAAISVLISFWVKWMGWSSFITMAISACLYFGGYILLLSLVKDPLIFEIKKKVCTIYHRIVIR